MLVSAVSTSKTAEPIELSFCWADSCGPKEYVYLIGYIRAPPGAYDLTICARFAAISSEFHYNSTARQYCTKISLHAESNLVNITHYYEGTSVFHVYNNKLLL